MVLVQKELKNAYIGEYAEPMPAWIYHNAGLGLISLSSDWETWITIADKNLWAYSVWNSWAGLSQDNCWYYYQCGNNYWFRWSWTISPTSTSSVNAGTYWPWNYYSSSTFIKTSPRDSSYNTNLRWWVTWTNEAMRWPCSSWYHIPSKTEWVNVYNIWKSLWWWSSDWTNFWLYLKLPFAWNRNVNTNINSQWSQWYYWASNFYSWEVWYSLFFGGSYIYPQNTSNASNAYSIRPFKNEAVQPDASRTKLY